MVGTIGLCRIGHLQHSEPLYVPKHFYIISPEATTLIPREDYAQCLPATAATTTTTSAQTTTTTTSKTTLTSTTTNGNSQTITTTTSTTTAPASSGNPFSGYQLYANPYYSSEVVSLAIPSLSSSLAAQASAVAKVPSFVWL